METKKQAPSERTREISRKKAQQKGDKQSIRYKFEVMVIKMCNSIEKDIETIIKD